MFDNTAYVFAFPPGAFSWRCFGIYAENAAERWVESSGDLPEGRFPAIKDEEQFPFIFVGRRFHREVLANLGRSSRSTFGSRTYVAEPPTFSSVERITRAVGNGVFDNGVFDRADPWAGPRSLDGCLGSLSGHRSSGGDLLPQKN